nr:MAG TPA: hypothetical protein [Caudoviricetes sp.]
MPGVLKIKQQKLFIWYYRNMVKIELNYRSVYKRHKSSSISSS